MNNYLKKISVEYAFKKCQLSKQILPLLQYHLAPRAFAPGSEGISGFGAFPLNVWARLHMLLAEENLATVFTSSLTLKPLYYSLAYLAMKSSSKLQWALPSVWFPCSSGQSSFMICFHVYNREYFYKGDKCYHLKNWGDVGLFFIFNVGKTTFMELLFAHITPQTHQSKHLLK